MAVNITAAVHKTVVEGKGVTNGYVSCVFNLPN